MEVEPLYTHPEDAPGGPTRRCTQCGGEYAIGGFVHDKHCPKIALGNVKAAVRAAIRDGVVAVYPGRVPEESVRHAQKTGLATLRDALNRLKGEGETDG